MLTSCTRNCVVRILKISKLKHYKLNSKRLLLLTARRQQDAFVKKVTIIKDKFCEFIYDMS